MTGNVPRYGVHTQIHSETAVDQTVEAIRLVGLAVVNGGYSADKLQKFANHKDEAFPSDATVNALR